MSMAVRGRGRWLLGAALLAWLGAGDTARAQGEPAEIEVDAIWRDLESTTLAENGTQMDGAELSLGAARLRLLDGVVVETVTRAARRVEWLFLGRGRVELSIEEDTVEARQLWLFGGEQPWVAWFDQAVLVGFDREDLSGMSRVLDARESELVGQLHEQWRASAEHRLGGLDASLLARALGDAGAEHHRVAWLHIERHGWVVVELDRAHREPLTVGQFVPFDLTEGEQKRARRELDRAQRRGRLREVTLEGLGTWDSWVSTAAGGDSGQPSFEARHYSLEAEVQPRNGRIDGRVKIELEAVAGGRRMLELYLHPDLEVRSILARDGSALPLRRVLDRTVTVLPVALEPGERTTLEIEYGGTALETRTTPGRRAFVLVDTLYWYPHVGERDLATYELELSWPRRFELFAPGTPLDGGLRGPQRWLRHRIDIPTKAVSFEIGRFDVIETRVDGLEIVLARDRLSGAVLNDEEALLRHVTDALRFLEERFGKLPWRRLTVVTAPRPFSQSLLGFVTLSTSMMVDDVSMALAGGEDPRTVIAHELAHQWWGHTVTWDSYRDLWLSEALASYSALLYARRGIENLGPWAGPVTGWEGELLEPTAGGRTVEAMGPLVLGDRLNSSRARAWVPVAYLKGPLVLDLLAREIGEPAMLGLLRGLAVDGPARVVETGELLAAMTAVAGRSLEQLAQALVYGTGIPRFEYSIRPVFPAQGARIEVTVQEVPELESEFRVRATDAGELDVRRSLASKPLLLSGQSLEVPFELWLLDEATLPPAARGRRWRDAIEQARRSGNVREVGWVEIGPGTSELTLELRHDLRRLVLDPGAELPARFDNASDNRKRALLEAALRARAAEDDDAAEVLLQKSLASIDVAVWEEPGAFDEARRILDVRSQAELARLAIDRGREGAAEEYLEAGRRRADGAPGWLKGILDEVIEEQQWRLWLAQGRSAEVYFQGRDRVGAVNEPSTEGLLLLAVAARSEGDDSLTKDILSRPAVRQSRVFGLELMLD